METLKSELLEKELETIISTKIVDRIKEIRESQELSRGDWLEYIRPKCKMKSSSKDVYKLDIFFVPTFSDVWGCINNF